MEIVCRVCFRVEVAELDNDDRDLSSILRSNLEALRLESGISADPFKAGYSEFDFNASMRTWFTMYTLTVIK